MTDRTAALTAWRDVQRQWWDGWFTLMGGATRALPGGDMWQSSFDAWHKTVDTVLAPQPSTPSAEQMQHSAVLAEPIALSLGASASFSKTIQESDIVAFAELSGDVNPVHLDDDFAAKTRFGGRIAHGMLSAGLISAVLGTKLPGPGAVYLSQSLKFRAPVRIGDEITATVTVVSQKEDKPIYTLETVCTNQRDEKILVGEAVILYEPVG